MKFGCIFCLGLYYYSKSEAQLIGLPHSPCCPLLARVTAPSAGIRHLGFDLSTRSSVLVQEKPHLPQASQASFPGVSLFISCQSGSALSSPILA